MCVEGECENLYFEHLKKLINQSNSKYLVDFQTKVERSLHSFLSVYRPDCPVFYVWDHESTGIEDESNFEKAFHEILKFRKTYDIQPGYTHLTFELWILLHRGTVPAVGQKNNYLTIINDYYNKEFKNLSHYKQKDNFKQMLDSISLEDVKLAIERGDFIRKQKSERHERPRVYGCYKTYSIDPDLFLHECVKRIMKECKVY